MVIKDIKESRGKWVVKRELYGGFILLGELG